MNAYYRVVVPLRELERRGHRVLWPELDSIDELLTGTPNCDVFVMHHFFQEEDLARVERLRRAGIAVVWDKDDDLSATPRWIPSYKTYGGRRGIKRGFARSIEIACAASLMTTPSAHLAQRFRDKGVEHVEMIENHVAPEHVGPARQRHQGVVIGITAGLEHGPDIERLRIDETLRRLMRAHAGVRVVSIGWDHDLPKLRHQNRRNVPVRELIAAEREFDIGLAPLVDSAFNRARSNVKLKEYAAAGAMWLASPVGSYRGMGEEQGGLLVADRDWYDVLDALVVDFRRRTALTERARAWAKEQSADRAVGRWEAAFRGAIARAGARQRS